MDPQGLSNKYHPPTESWILSIHPFWEAYGHMGRNSVVFSDSGDPHESLIFLPPDMFEGQIRRKP